MTGTPDRAAQPRAGAPLTCLLVDDSPVFLTAARTLLERQGLRVVGAAGTAEEGYRLARSRSPDVVLVDIALGTDSGFDLAQRLATDATTAGTTVVLISTRSEDDLAELVQASPAVGFLPKAELSARSVLSLFGHREP